MSFKVASVDFGVSGKAMTLAVRNTTAYVRKCHPVTIAIIPSIPNGLNGLG